MATKNRAPTLWCMLLLLLVLFTTTTFSREVTQDISVHDFQEGIQAAAVGTAKLPEQSFGLQDAVEKVGDPPTTTTIETTTTTPITTDPLTNSGLTPAPAGSLPANLVAAKDKGADFLALLKCPTADQSPFVERKALFDNGWVNLRFPPVIQEPSTKPESHNPVSAEDPEIFKQLGVSSKDQDILYYNWMHAKTDQMKGELGHTEFDYGPEYGHPKEYGLTKGTYGNIFNPKDGLLICFVNFGPTYKISQGNQGPAPPLNKLSDILWFQWKDAVAAKGGQVGNIKYFWRHNVVDKKSKAIMDGIAAIPGQDLVAYPGKTYSMTEGGLKQEIGQALLGSPNGVAVTYFLAQHRAEIGKMKTVSKVQLFSTGGGPGGRISRHMLFSVVDVE
ncbi:hypothetical protein LTR27_001815 [Elasticomyces elasticus]|nr:hypothetical protein LTR27_001815 [Elasticomyces elasticus]